MKDSDSISRSDRPLVPADATERFVSLLTRYEFELRGLLVTLLGNAADADDVWQRTSIILWRKFGQWQPDTDFVAWAAKVARLEVRNFVRGRARDRLHFDDSLVDSLWDMRTDLRDDLAARREALGGCLKKLRSDDRDLIALCYAERATTAKSVATVLGKKVNTVYKALIRIRRTLFECVERTLAVEGRP